MHARQRGRTTDDGCGCKRWLMAFTLFFAVIVAVNGQFLQVSTRFGTIWGIFSNSTRGRTAIHYLGVPYAEPPIGELRFKSPRPWNRSWPIAYIATANRNVCLQLNHNGNIIGSENCLYLNIFVPVDSQKPGVNSGLPVMVYVHGDKYSSGSSNSRKLPPDYLMDQDVILVTVNYRLNILGFLSTGSDASPGNYGLKDVLMALQWIQENICSFNGDPGNVTLWGHGSGASMVHALALTNKTEGLFNRYILQSGNALCPWAISTRSWARRATLHVANWLGCLPQKINDEENEKRESNNATTTTASPEVTTVSEDRDVEYEEYSEEDEQSIMDCLRKVNVKKLGKILKHYRSWDMKPCCIFALTIETESEDALMTSHPLNTIKTGHFRDIPFIMGVTKDDGLMKMSDNTTFTSELINNFKTHLPYSLEYYQLISNVTAFVDAIDEFYFPGNRCLSDGQNVTEMVSDALFLWPAYQTLKCQSEKMNSSTYFYLFDYEGTFTSTFSSKEMTRYGVAHADDLNYLIPILNKKHKDQMLHNTESDVAMINIMTEMWASFAATGVPKAWRIPSWPDYKDSHEFLQFGVGRYSEVIVADAFFPERMAFWEQLTANLTIFREIEDYSPFVIPIELIFENDNNDSIRAVGCTILVYTVMLFVTHFW
ncbi:esterase FE4 [Xylocopa sonorina]|uniref:esterase FE4 n=1 Tax=Xylocopa sonorina TaxID=1818115 RepID=UPI00403A8DD2